MDKFPAVPIVWIASGRILQAPLPEYGTSGGEDGRSSCKSPPQSPRVDDNTTPARLILNRIFCAGAVSLEGSPRCFAQGGTKGPGAPPPCPQVCSWLAPPRRAPALSRSRALGRAGSGVGNSARETPRAPSDAAGSLSPPPPAAPWKRYVSSVLPARVTDRWRYREACCRLV